MASNNTQGVIMTNVIVSIEQNDGSEYLYSCKSISFNRSSNCKKNRRKNAVKVVMAENIEAKTCLGEIVL